MHIFQLFTNNNLANTTFQLKKVKKRAHRFYTMKNSIKSVSSFE